MSSKSLWHEILRLIWYSIVVICFSHYYLYFDFAFFSIYISIGWNLELLWIEINETIWKNFEWMNLKSRSTKISEHEWWPGQKNWQQCGEIFSPSWSVRIKIRSQSPPPWPPKFNLNFLYNIINAKNTELKLLNV